jgi:hypothetical protein
MVTGLGNELDGRFSSFFSGLDVAPIMTHGAIHVPDRFFISSALGIPVFLRQFWCNTGKKLVLIKFHSKDPRTISQTDHHPHMKDRRP